MEIPTSIKGNKKKMRTLIITAVVVVLAVILIGSSVTVIPAGSKGVLLNMGAVSGQVLDEGVPHPLYSICENCGRADAEI